MYYGERLNSSTHLLGLALAVGLWSAAAMAHACVRSVLGFGAVRGALVSRH